MRVALVQFDIKKNIHENISYIKSKLENILADFVILPELSISGYLQESLSNLESKSISVPKSDIISEFLSISKLYSNTIIFGVAEIENNKIYNSAIVVSKGVYIGKYRKQHLTRYEQQFFVRGNDNMIFDIDNVKFGVQICYDTWFPEVSREQLLKGADLIFVLGNYGGMNTYNILHTRAIENNIPIVVCNRVGEEKVGDIEAKFLGKSAVIDSNGNDIVALLEYKEDVKVVDIKMREKNKNMLCDNIMQEIVRHYDNK